MTAERQKDRRTAGHELPHFAGREFSQTPFQQGHFVLDQKR
jgi:hypothetical protein